MILAAIPSIGLAPQLPALVRQLRAEGVVDEIWLMVNRPKVKLGVRAVGNTKRLNMVGWSLYKEWNLAIAYAKAQGGRVLLLNDDIELTPGATAALLGLMGDHPDVVAMGFDYEAHDTPRVRYCSGSYRCHGVNGCAFALDALRTPVVDEQFEWWYGEDDLFAQIERQGGRCAVAEGCTVRHYASTSADQAPWTFAARDRDRVRFEAKWEVA